MNTSYGVILFKLNKNNNEILMINRKDSLCYIDFIRGKYKINNLEYIKILLSRMSDSEINNIKTKQYSELWKSLWNIKTDDLNKNKEYKQSEKKFNKIKTIKDIFNIKGYSNSEWEFPKGKKNNKETNKEGACRELEEETNINRSDYKLLNNIIPITEKIIAENNIIYKNIYYLGICTNDNNIFINKDNKNQINEIKKVEFMNKQMSIDLIRDYNQNKVDIINKLFNLIDNNNFEIK